MAVRVGLPLSPPSKRIIGVRLPWWLSGKESACNAGSVGDAGLTPVSGRSSGAGHGNPLQHSCLQNSMNKGAWQATVQRVCKESDMTEET